jgi:hypothetical protein
MRHIKALAGVYRRARRVAAEPAMGIAAGDI